MRHRAWIDGNTHCSLFIPEYKCEERVEMSVEEMRICKHCNHRFWNLFKDLRCPACEEKMEEKKEKELKKQFFAYDDGQVNVIALDLDIDLMFGSVNQLAEFTFFLNDVLKSVRAFEE